MWRPGWLGGPGRTSHEQDSGQAGRCPVDSCRWLRGGGLWERQYKERLVQRGSQQEHQFLTSGGLTSLASAEDKVPQAHGRRAFGDPDGRGARGDALASHRAVLAPAEDKVPQAPGRPALGRPVFADHPGRGAGPRALAIDRAALTVLGAAFAVPGGGLAVPGGRRAWFLTSVAMDPARCRRDRRRGRVARPALWQAVGPGH